MSYMIDRYRQQVYRWPNLRVTLVMWCDKTGNLKF